MRCRALYCTVLAAAVVDESSAVLSRGPHPTSVRVRMITSTLTLTLVPSPNSRCVDLPPVPVQKRALGMWRTEPAPTPVITASQPSSGRRSRKASAQGVVATTAPTAAQVCRLARH